MAYRSMLQPEVPDPNRPTNSSRADIATPGIDPQSSLAQVAAALSRQGMGQEAAELALDLILHQIVEQACLATNATGAAIAMEREGEIVCRASAGTNAPGLGVRLNVRSGLSGMCVQTRRPQICEDTEYDPRVNAEVCRELGVRSILVLPILMQEQVAGVFEIFSPRPHAFGDRDVLTIDALSRRVVEGVRGVEEAQSLPDLEGQSAAGASSSPTLASVPTQTSAVTQSPATIRREDLAVPLPEPPAFLSGPLSEKHRAAHDYGSGALMAVVIGLALLIGWMLGYARWKGHPATSQMPLAVGSPTSSEPFQSGGATTETHSPPSTPEIVGVAPGAPLSVPPKPRSGASAGGLVVYQDGRVIFSVVPRVHGASTVAEAGKAATSPATIAPELANNYVIHRVEPQYPEEARDKHIQGPVVLNTLVGVDGTVQELKVVTGDALLAPAAADAVRQWQFKPYRRNGTPVEFETRITVNFMLP